MRVHTATYRTEYPTPATVRIRETHIPDRSVSVRRDGVDYQLLKLTTEEEHEEDAQGGRIGAVRFHAHEVTLRPIASFTAADDVIVRVKGWDVDRDLGEGVSESFSPPIW